MTKNAFDSYLFLDGKPKATTTMDTNDAAVKDANGKYNLESVLAVRDKRLALLSILYYALRVVLIAVPELLHLLLLPVMA